MSSSSNNNNTDNNHNSCNKNQNIHTEHHGLMATGSAVATGLPYGLAICSKTNWPEWQGQSIGDVSMVACLTVVNAVNARIMVVDDS